ncbi:hypothetical protein OHC33_000310 [Knufia fluminis]|uniref:NAD(P)-binding protein n=1 Tax=Knufia fluminis TaxID=191047 RepID=A0AAN8ETI8_9EURO|nr:hypothetical protein OHC33_000310 [Knufia fluminis]
MPDPPLAALNNFTPTQHGPTIPPNLSLPDTPLPPNFTILILGASEGIGEHIAHAYARASAHTIILSSRTLPNLQRVKSTLHTINPAVRVEILPCDISSPPSVEILSLFIKNTIGRLDCTIVNAAYAPPITLKTHLDSPDHVQRAFDTNCMGTFNAAHYLVPLLLETPDGTRQFLAIGSMAGSIRRGHIANMGYCVSKMAQTRMVEYLHEQCGAEADGGLFALTVHPGAVMTGMARGNTPETFVPFLVDDVGLCGAFVVGVSKRVGRGELGWLGGRFVSATWDVDELVGRREVVVGRDLLRFQVGVE